MGFSMCHILLETFYSLDAIKTYKSKEKEINYEK